MFVYSRLVYVVSTPTLWPVWADVDYRKITIIVDDTRGHAETCNAERNDSNHLKGVRRRGTVENPLTNRYITI